MSLTRANVEQVLTKRAGGLMERLGLDGSTSSGQNADLNDCLGWSLRQMSLTVDDSALVDDEDVARVAADDYNEFFDLAEYRLLQTMNIHAAGLIVPSKDMQGHAFLVSAIERVLKAKLVQVQQDYGYGIGRLSGGVVDLVFMEQHE